MKEPNKSEWVEKELAVLKELPIPAPSKDLLLPVRGIPEWKIGWALLRRPVRLGILLGFFAACATMVWNWSDPLSYTLTVRGSDRVVRVDETLTLFRGMTVNTQPGQTVEMRLVSAEGLVHLQEGGPLIVRAAGIRRFSGVPQLVFELPRGAVSLWFADIFPHDCRILTPQSIIRLAGTWVQVRSLGSVTQVKVFSGSAEIFNTITGKKFFLTAGKEAEISARGITARPLQASEEKGASSTGRTEKSEPGGGANGGGPLWYEVKP
jgi:hypothetical protein